MAQKYASMAAKDTREAGSLWEGKGRITNVQFTNEPPDGYNAEGAQGQIFGANVTIVADPANDKDKSSDQERTQKQWYSLGGKASEEFTISEDGYGLIPVDESVSSLRKGTKWDMFKCSLENEGVSSSIFEQGDMSKLIGVYGEFRRVNDPERNFNDDGKKRKESKFKPQTLVCVKLLALPGEKAVNKPNGAVAGAQPTSAPAADVPEGDLDTVTATYLQRVLSAAKDKRIQRSQLTLALNTAALKDKHEQRQDIAKRGADETFLASMVELGIVQYDPAAKPQYVTLSA